MQKLTPYMFVCYTGPRPCVQCRSHHWQSCSLGQNILDSNQFCFEKVICIIVLVVYYLKKNYLQFVWVNVVTVTFYNTNSMATSNHIQYEIINCYAKIFIAKLGLVIQEFIYVQQSCTCEMYFMHI